MDGHDPSGQTSPLQGGLFPSNQETSRMRVEVQLTAEPIVPPRWLGRADSGMAGACVEFTGVVRGEENGQRIAALEYE
ncbi:MAG: molybdenum cofactor biosynthesis protein MoaE, partial [Verrucomicrobiae bacterium]|nr:molybdenum cofactor biosynthesis protein MoaE [Verrucomicrobiae bacterium]